MSCTTDEPLAIRRTKSRIASHTQALKEELSESAQHRAMQAAVHSLAYSALSLWNDWRSFVALLSGGGDAVDLRELRKEVERLARESKGLFETIRDLTRDCSIDSHAVAEIKLACHEVENLLTWVESWPGDEHAKNRRQAAREAMATGELQSIDEILQQA